VAGHVHPRRRYAPVPAPLTPGDRLRGSCGYWPPPEVALQGGTGHGGSVSCVGEPFVSAAPWITAPWRDATSSADAHSAIAIHITEAIIVHTQRRQLVFILVMIRAFREYPTHHWCPHLGCVLVIVGARSNLGFGFLTLGAFLPKAADGTAIRWTEGTATHALLPASVSVRSLPSARGGNGTCQRGPGIANPPVGADERAVQVTRAAPIARRSARAARPGRASRPR